jgi:uncharacterized protein (DUF2236 family)
MFDPVRREFFKGVRFDEPQGDSGWFGPDSAVWYLHSHLPSFGLGVAAAAMMETLHPDMAWMAYAHTRALERVDGQPTGNFDERAMASRGGETMSFFLSVALGPSETADRVSRIVRAMHNRVEGTRPDGRPYSASDPQLLRWNYATMAYMFAAAHERYHPRPMRGARLDEFFREYARMGRELGAEDVPTTRDEVEQVLLDSRPFLGVTMPTVELLNPTAPWRFPAYQRPFRGLFHWAAQDLHPEWMQRLMNVPRLTSAHKSARRAALRTAFRAAGDGVLREVHEAHARTGRQA